MKPSKLRAQIAHALAGSKIHILAWLIFVVLVIFLLIAGIEFKTVLKVWTDHIDPWLGIAVLIIAVLLFAGERSQDWGQSLPCLLTVVFRFKGQEVMRCENAALANEADMRALGQTIGAQMVDETLKFFAPSVKQSGGEPIWTREAGWHRHYDLEIVLRDLPKNIEDLPKNKVLVWRPDFVKDPEREDT